MAKDIGNPAVFTKAWKPVMILTIRKLPIHITIWEHLGTILSTISPAMTPLISRSPGSKLPKTDDLKFIKNEHPEQPDGEEPRNNSKENPILYEISCTNTKKEYRLTVYANQNQN